MARSTSPGTAGRRRQRRLAVAGAVTVLCLVALFFAARHQPSNATGRIPAGTDLERAAARMLTKASAIRAGLDRPGAWGEAISETEVNAWLVHDLARVAPGALPPWMRSPAVRFMPRRIAVSMDVGTGPLTARAWAIVSVMVPSDNELAIDVESAGLGALPLPAGTVLDALGARAIQAGLQAESRRFEGRPALVVRLPGRIGTAPGTGSEYHLEGLRIDDGELVVAGTTRPAAGR